MRNFLFVLTVSILFLSGCGPIYSTQYNFTPPQTSEGKICANECLDKKNACFNVCEIKQEECRKINARKAETDYLQYLAITALQDKPIEKEKKDFINYSGCSSRYCSNRCPSTHRLCHSNCGGQVRESTICTSFCD